MADFFLQLPLDERREALGVAAASSGRPMHLLDKDVWVVWVLEALFQAPFAAHLVFKGGSSLSKAYQIIRRFSEDVDLTYDIRVLAPDLVGGDDEPLPPNRSQEKRWTKEIRTRLPLWIRDQVVPLISRALSGQRLAARVSTEGEKVFVEYEPVAKGSGYTRPTVMLEFGARSTGEPCEMRPISCDAAQHLPGVVFPAANPRVMRPERTFWEKATAIHVFCAQGEFHGGNRFARHWHDITRLDSAGIVKTAFADRSLSLVWKPIAEKAGMAGTRFHDLRHFFASQLIAQGETAAYVRDQMGHSSIKVTFDTYGHLFPGRGKEASARYEKSMADAKVRHKAEASVSNPLAIDAGKGPEGTVTN